MKSLITRMFGIYLNTLAYFSPKKAGETGFLIFCRPMRIPLNQKQKEFLNTADKFSLDYNGVSVQGYKWGNGSKKILFLHGWQSHTYRWKAYIDSLSKQHYTIYSLDAPGHGNSKGNFLSVPVYSELIQQFLLELGEVHTVVGHSLGGFSLLYTFYQFPLLPVRKVILMAPPGEASDFMNVLKSTLKLSDKTMEHITAHFVERYDVGPDFFSTSKFAGSLNINGLIIHDEGDKEAPYHYSKMINKAWKRSTLMTTKGFGHNLKSAVVVEALVNFIEEEVPHHAETSTEDSATSVHSLQ